MMLWLDTAEHIAASLWAQCPDGDNEDSPTTSLLVTRRISKTMVLLNTLLNAFGNIVQIEIVHEVSPKLDTRTLPPPEHFLESMESNNLRKILRAFS